MCDACFWVYETVAVISRTADSNLRWITHKDRTTANTVSKNSPFIFNSKQTITLSDEFEEKQFY